MNYSTILQRFGTPLKNIPSASAPWKTWQKIAGVAILALAAYGAHTLYTKYYKEDEYPKLVKK